MTAELAARAGGPAECASVEVEYVDPDGGRERRPLAGGGLGGPGRHRGSEQVDLGGQRGRVHGVASLADRLAHQLLHRGESLGGLRGPAPTGLAARRRRRLAVRAGRASSTTGDPGRVGVVWGPGIVDGDPANRGRMPIAWIACLPRLECTVSRVYLPVRAQCTQASRPATRNPVSSNPATSLAAICAQTCSRNPSSHPAAQAVSAATVPDEHGIPNSSPSASAVRSFDRNCPAYRYTMIAAIRGPYCTGASAPAGAAALVRCPQPHSRSINWCSVTSARTGRRSKTWRRSTPVTGRPASPAPHRPQQPGSWRISQSGLSTCASVVPLCPSCPPGLRPLRLRSDRGLGAGLASPSLDGGLEEFRGFCFSRASSSAIRSRARASSARACFSAPAASASSGRSDATSAASTSYCDGCSSPGTPGRYALGMLTAGISRDPGVSPATRGDVQLDKPGRSPGYRGHHH